MINMIIGYINKKAWKLTSMLVPPFEALALPFSSERATLKPTPICIHHTDKQPYNNGCLPMEWIYHINIGIYRCFASLTRVETARFQKGQEQSVNIVNAFPKMSANTISPIVGLKHA